MALSRNELLNSRLPPIDTLELSEVLDIAIDSDGEVIVLNSIHGSVDEHDRQCGGIYRMDFSDPVRTEALITRCTANELDAERERKQAIRKHRKEAKEAARREVVRRAVEQARLDRLKAIERLREQQQVEQDRILAEYEQANRLKLEAEAKAAGRTYDEHVAWTRREKDIADKVACFNSAIRYAHSHDYKWAYDLWTYDVVRFLVTETDYDIRVYGKWFGVQQYHLKYKTAFIVIDRDGDLVAYSSLVDQTINVFWVRGFDLHLPCPDFKTLYRFCSKVNEGNVRRYQLVIQEMNNFLNRHHNTRPSTEIAETVDGRMAFHVGPKYKPRAALAEFVQR